MCYWQADLNSQYRYSADLKGQIQCVIWCADLKEGQIQCGEHSDYGTITLLFQDNTGGLQVSNITFYSSSYLKEDF